MQTPAVHILPAPHWLSHAPQLLTSVLRLRHVSPHCVCPLGHIVWQTLLMHMSPRAQAMHPPQWLGSLVMLVQAPLQTMSEALPPQLATHAPATHTLPSAQTLPQA